MAEEDDFAVVHRLGSSITIMLMHSCDFPCRQEFCGRHDYSPDAAHEARPNIAVVAVSVHPFQTHNSEEVTRLQMDDPIIGLLYHAASSGKLLCYNELSVLGRESKLLLQQWECLLIKDGLLWRRDSEGRKGLRLIVPFGLRCTVLKDIYEEAVGGHLGEGKMLG